MKAAWTVIWEGRSCVAFFKEQDSWSLDPDEAKVFESWFAARFAAGIQLGVRVVRCWV